MMLIRLLDMQADQLLSPITQLAYGTERKSYGAQSRHGTELVSPSKAYPKSQPLSLVQCSGFGHCSALEDFGDFVGIDSLFFEQALLEIIEIFAV